MENFNKVIIGTANFSEDYKILDQVIKDHGMIITMEEGVVIGGFGASILNYCKNHKIIIELMGIEDNFIEHGTRQELLDLVGLNANSLINLIDNYINSQSEEIEIG